MLCAAIDRRPKPKAAQKMPSISTNSTTAYYDRQYNARASVQDPLAYMTRYTQESQAAFALPGAVRNQRYSPRATDVLDIYLPAARAAKAQAAPVFIFIHGGYWKALGKDDSAFMAPALTQEGAIVVVPDYDLAPAVSLDHIVEQMRQAYAWVVRNIAIYGGDERNICVCGSSAGGHLAGMLLAKDWQQDYDLPAQAVPRSVLTLSGLFDLQPLLTTHINSWMQLGDAAAIRNSPRFLLPDASTHGQCQLRVSCGEFESHEFKRQSRDYLAAWQARCLPGQWVDAPATNHFDLPLQLADPQSAIYQTALQLMGLDQSSSSMRAA
ncbi:putative esterase [Comamonas testosteroni]|nr:putative esterase [Comamonas testosteroni]